MNIHPSQSSDLLCDRCGENFRCEHRIGHSQSDDDLMQDTHDLQMQLKTTNLARMKKDFRQRLEQWCAESHQTVERFFDRKSRELDRYVDETFDQHRTEMNRIRASQSAANHQEETNGQELQSVRFTLDDLRKKIQSFEQLHEQLNIIPLPINDDLIQMINTPDQQRNVSLLLPVHETINHPDASLSALASNERFFLVYLSPYLTFVDRKLDISTQLRWPYGSIRDMCWSSASDRFVLVERSNVYFVDDRSMSIEKLPIESKQNWSSCTSSDESLFLSTDERASSIRSYRIRPSIGLRKQWKFPLTCAKEESIDQIVYQNSTLALLISHKTARMELRSPETLHRLWTYPFDSIGEGVLSFHLCSLNFDEWLITDRSNERLLHITNEGNLKSMVAYNSEPSRAVLFQPNLLVISRRNGINFHDLSNH